MLDCLKLDTKVSDTDMKTTESNGYREMSRSDRDANGVLIIIWERTRSSCKNE